MRSSAACAMLPDSSQCTHMEDLHVPLPIGMWTRLTLGFLGPRTSWPPDGISSQLFTFCLRISLVEITRKFFVLNIPLTSTQTNCRKLFSIEDLVQTDRVLTLTCDNPRAKDQGQSSVGSKDKKKKKKKKGLFSTTEKINTMHRITKAVECCRKSKCHQSMPPDVPYKIRVETDRQSDGQRRLHDLPPV